MQVQLLQNKTFHFVETSQANIQQKCGYLFKRSENILYEKDINKKNTSGVCEFAFSHSSSTYIHSKSAFIWKLTTVFSKSHEAHEEKKLWFSNSNSE